jgi:glycosyltransferase involved in cell wall biosynthesis
MADFQGVVLKKILISINTTWNLVNFRSGLIRSLQGSGYEVIAVAPPDEYIPKLIELGCRYIPVSMDNKGTHPLRDFVLFVNFLKILAKERPALFLGYTVKPNVYGSLAANLLGIPVVNNIAGLGATFIRDSWLTRVVKFLYRFSLSRSSKVFFQNKDDKHLFVAEKLVRPEIVDLLPGSGIDLKKFSVAPFKATASCRFLLIARLLWDKGVGEYVEAARILRAKYPDIEFAILGFLDVQNPAAISRDQMNLWIGEGVIIYLGQQDDVRAEIAAADCIVLPSYREGTPRSLLEAAAMGRPIVTTDTVGCREVVDDHINGFLCKVKDTDDLALKMEAIYHLSPLERLEMGLAGRRKVEQEFDEQIVIRKYLEAIEIAICKNDFLSAEPQT